MAFIKVLSELGRTDLVLAGGKGAQLGALIQAGLPVPPGFCITTEGYRAFVQANGLEAEIRRVLAASRLDDPVALEAASTEICARFQSGAVPDLLADAIRQAYAALAGARSQNQPLAVAVRSSATAEDLPDLSFAGQQDTELNVVGEQALIPAVVRCWGSLWNARAIGYRARNHISQDEVALAVVVQQMVPSEASGVLFTANPLTGKRTETVIDATLGLGEALVSGQVEPDHYVVESASGRILSKTLGAKALAIHGQPGGGTVTVQAQARERQALPDAQIVELVRLGQRAAQHAGSPQDLEWAWAAGTLYVLQSRSITSLYPLPEGVAPQPLEVLFSFAVWQGMLDPYTPFGRDLFSGLVAALARLFGTTFLPTEQRVLLTAGERMFVNITGLLHNSIGRAVVGLFIPAIDPVSGAILEQLLKDLQLPAPDRLKLRTRLRMVRALAPVAANVIFNLLCPARGRIRLQTHIDATLDFVRARCTTAKTLFEQVAAVEESLQRAPQLLMPQLLPGVIAGQMPLQVLLRLANDLPDGPSLVMELTRGLPHNVTTEMDLVLWDVARAIRADPTALAYVAAHDAPTLAADYHARSLPPVAQAAVAHFLLRYGMRGVAEIDVGRPRWDEDPTHIFRVLKSYLQIEDGAASPDAMFRQGAEGAQRAQQQLVTAFRRTHGWLAAQRVRFLANRLRALGGLRETPKFTVIRIMGYLRTGLLVAGQRLVADGTLEHADDLFFLHMPELKALGLGVQRDWKALVAQRRADYARELRRKRIPRLMLSDGTAFYDAAEVIESSDAMVLRGSPVSAGVVEGIVHVVHDPHHAQLLPGEILVCPATDPAWTPLFLAAGGLVMEVGGMMTHGSVVAREYGIPAVVGVPEATTRLRNGQRVRVDGASGQIVILGSET